MSTTVLRNNLHELIDKIENNDLLEAFYSFLLEKTKPGGGRLWPKLTKEQRDEILKAYEESEDEQNLIDHKTVSQKHKKWL